MATVGDILLLPEEGWRRYDDDLIDVINYNGVWSSTTGTPVKWNGTESYTNIKHSFLEFDFIGKNIRILDSLFTNRDTKITITIDDNSETYSGFNTITTHRVIQYEKLNLENTRHRVKISKTSDDSSYLCIDAIDIDANGVLLNIDEVTSISDLEVGKKLRCVYRTVGNNGVFQGLGNQNYIDGINDFLPFTPSSFPYGNFYFICVKKDQIREFTLIADRNIRSGVSWDAYNSSFKYEAGSKVTASIVPKMTAYNQNNIKISVSGNYSSDYGWKAFDEVLLASNYWYVSSGAPAGGHWLKIELPQRRKVTEISLVAFIVSGANHSLRDFTFFGSNDDITYTELFSATHPNNAVIKNYKFKNDIYYKYYRINIKSSYYNATTYVGICEMQLFEEIILDSEHTYTYDFGFMTSSEWDDYIVNSDLNGTIQKGDDAIWHWNIYNVRTLTSSTGYAQGARINRGNGIAASVPNGINALCEVLTSDSSSARGYRPKLILTSKNTPPYILTENPITVTNCSRYNLTAKIEDIDGDLVRWKADGDAFSEWQETPLSIEKLFELDHGTNFIRIIVEDFFGNINTYTNRLEYINSSPELMEIAFSKTYFWNTNEESIVFSANVSDIENDLFRYQIRINGEVIKDIPELIKISYIEETFPSKLLTLPRNTFEIEVYDNYSYSSIFTYNLILEDRDLPLFERRMHYDTSFIPNSTFDFKSSVGYKLTGFSSGELKVSFPTEGKNTVKKFSYTGSAAGDKEITIKQPLLSSTPVSSGNIHEFDLSNLKLYENILSISLLTKD